MDKRVLNTPERSNLDLHSLVIFHGLLRDEVVAKFSALLASTGGTALERMNAYSAFAAALWEHGGNWTDYLLRRTLEDENAYVHALAQGGVMPPLLEQTLPRELGVLEGLSRLTAGEILAGLDYPDALPGWDTGTASFTAAFRERMAHLSAVGYGPFARHHMFTCRHGELEPVLWPDPIELADLTGYEAERQAVIGNTLALLSGKPAANVLLYGDAGTGKSSCIKAIANGYRSLGLRLVEVPRDELGSIPAIVGRLSGNPLKFILFIDDLSFEREGGEFSALKAFLEGSVAARTPNVAVYATSNRRHLIRETFADRDGDDVHRNETLQELGALADRFGLSVGFFRPGKELYLEIVHRLRDRRGITLPPAEIDQLAERFALTRGGRSPRVALQFIESLLRTAE